MAYEAVQIGLFRADQLTASGFTDRQRTVFGVQTPFDEVILLAVGKGQGAAVGSLGIPGVLMGIGVGMGRLSAASFHAEKHALQIGMESGFS